MTRRHFTFGCDDCTLGATLDAAAGASGLLIVTGGNEIRAGAFNGQARLAAEIAAAGYPVLRFDRRGIGDSEGENRGFRASAPDIIAALAAFRAAVPQLRRVTGFGNCDAASTLMLASGAGCDALVLSNPWTIEDTAETDATPPPAAIRARYRAKLANPRELLRLLSGGVDLGKLGRGLLRAGRGAAPRSTLAGEMAAGIEGFAGPVRILLAEADRTAQVFATQWHADDPRIARCPRGGHAYAEPHAQQWLREQLVDILSS